MEIAIKGIPLGEDYDLKGKGVEVPKSKIEWTDHTINPVKGKCPAGCSYCYARKMYDRFKWNPEIRFDGNALTDFPSKPSRIFVGSTMELFGDWIKPEWMEQIMALPHNFPQHTFLFLTKQPQNLIAWSPFPPNVYLGVSVTNQEMFDKAVHYLKMVDAKVKFLSFEPLLDHIIVDKSYLEKRITLLEVDNVQLRAGRKQPVN